MREINLTQTHEKNEGLLNQIEAYCGQTANRCYQCAKCSGGCPLAFYMDYPPNMIMRMLQNGMVDEVLNSSTIWVCAACSTCTTRCPRDIDVACLMDALRIFGRKKGIVAKAKGALLFHNTFLNSVKSNGRLYELGLAANLNLRSGRLIKDAEFALPMLLKGKLKFLPHKIKGLAQIKRIYELSLQTEEDH